MPPKGGIFNYKLNSLFSGTTYSMKYFSLLLIVVCFACSGTKDSRPGLAGQLVGEWRNTYLKITMNTFRNSDTSKTVEADESNWHSVLKSQPVRTFFKADGTYNSEHRNLEDSIFYNPAGYWNISGDSIYMRDTFPKKGISYTYWLNIDGRNVTFRGREDFDQDGKRDDDYFGTQRKQ